MGIPTHQTERIIPNTRIQTNVIDNENQETFISLPALLGQKDAEAPHILVLKTPKKTFLLTPKIDIEKEIPDEDTHQLPQIFTGRFSFFKGACFSSQNMILLLEPEKLMGNIK